MDDIFLFGYSIDRMSGTIESRRSGTKAAAAGGVDNTYLKTFTQPTGAKLAPATAPATATVKKPRQSGSRSPPPPSPLKTLEDQELEANADFLSLSPIDWPTISLEQGQRIREEEWQNSPAKSAIPPLWMNMAVLQRAIELRGMPETPMPMPEGTQPMLIITVAPPCSGKGTVLETVYPKLGIQNKSCVLDADPDNMFYEVMTELLGWMPPKSENGWLYFAEAKRALGKQVEKATSEERESAKLQAKQEFHRYENFMPLAQLTRVNQRPTAPAWECTSRAKKIPIGMKYEQMLRITMDYIFNLATTNRLNIVLNVTGMSMLDLIDEYIVKATKVQYPVVIVGIHSTAVNCKARAKFRNSNQHRDMSETLVEGNNYDFQKKGAIFDWEQKSRENGYRFILLENTWTPGSPEGAEYVTLLCDRLGDGQFSEDGEPTGSLLTTGVYGMKWLQEPTPHFNIEEKEKVKAIAKAEAEAKAAAETAKASAAAAGQGGYSRKRRLHTNRPRKTMKKYARRVTRRRSRGHSRVGRRHTRHNRR